MNSYENYIDPWDEFYPGDESAYESDVFDELEYEEAYDESGEDGSLERRRKFVPRRSRYVSRAVFNRTMRGLSNRVERLRRMISGMGRRYGTPANVAQRIKALESNMSQLQKSQLYGSLLNIPQLDTIKFENEEGTKNVEKSTYSKDSILLLSLLNGGNLGGLNLGGGGNQNSLLPLLLLSGNGLFGGDGDNSNLLLLLLLFNQNP